MTRHSPAASGAVRGTSDQTAAGIGASAYTAPAGSSGDTTATTASPVGGGTAPEFGGRSASSRRHSTDAMSRDALDADLATAVRRTARMRQAFYVLVLLVALVGQVTGSVHTLDIPILVAIPAVAALELGGVVVMANADVRRRLGERALASRILSAVIAAAAVTFNWIVHPDHLLGGFYAAMSALGYLVWLMHAGNQRRDRLRATGDLPPTPPAYELFGHWLRHPAITVRARSIAKADGLDLYESLDAARVAISREHRQHAIAAVLRRKIRRAVDPTTAAIAVHVYDLDEIAQRLAATADYAGLTTLFAADLAPETIIARQHAGRRRRWWDRRPSATPTTVPPQRAPSAPGPAEQKQQPATDTHPTSAPDDRKSVPTPCPSTSTGPSTAGGPASDHGEPTSTAEAVAYWLRKEPDLAPEALAEKIGRSLRSVYRHLPADYPRRPGVAREHGRPVGSGRREGPPADMPASRRRP
ncbi:hypothetical protein [Micromonospora craniellae]|uniref:hypothetical protein n=1 Tax=Micromonospora craniellae TaxID=2294034 RepID=UPI001CC6EA36|nr:hypothetical protein [Micromonospora craniellae]